MNGNWMRRNEQRRNAKKNVLQPGRLRNRNKKVKRRKVEGEGGEDGDNPQVF